VACVNLAHGLSNSLDSKLDAALNALGDASERNDAAAVNSLQAFTNAVEAQRGKSISFGHSHYLMTAARSIAELLQ
jgi:hypothetical protein